jgi:hypothetical protein
MAVISKPKLAELDRSQRWDAEAFMPFLGELEVKLDGSPLLTKLATVTHPSEIARVYSGATNAIPFIRAQNIRPYLLEMEGVALIPADVAKDLPNNRLNIGDVLITRSGAFSGMAAVFLGKTGSCYTSGEGIIVRSLGGIEGAYLAVFFNTEAGAALCRRAIYGSGQPHIGPKYLELIKVPRFGNIEKEVTQLVRGAHDDLKIAETVYPEAQEELLDRLGWAEFANRTREYSYSANFSTLADSERIDPEYFHPAANRVREFLIQQNSMTIQDVCGFVEHGLQPTYLDGGTVGIVSQRQFRAFGLDLDSLEHFTNEAFCKLNADFRLRKGDVLTYSVSAGDYLGATFVFDSEVPCVAASFVT